jgi:hypothetical protein
MSPRDDGVDGNIFLTPSSVYKIPSDKRFPSNDVFIPTRH